MFRRKLQKIRQAEEKCQGAGAGAQKLRTTDSACRICRLLHGKAAQPTGELIQVEGLVWAAVRQRGDLHAQPVR